MNGCHCPQLQRDANILVPFVYIVLVAGLVGDDDDFDLLAGRDAVDAHKSDTVGCAACIDKNAAAFTFGDLAVLPILVAKECTIVSGWEVAFSGRCWRGRRCGSRPGCCGLQSAGVLPWQSALLLLSFRMQLAFAVAVGEDDEDDEVAVDGVGVGITCVPVAAGAVGVAVVVVVISGVGANDTPAVGEGGGIAGVGVAGSVRVVVPAVALPVVVPFVPLPVGRVVSDGS